VGYVSYYLADGTDGNLITKSILKANDGFTDLNSTTDFDSTTYTKAGDLDFDVKFNTQKVLKGLVLCSFTHILNVNTNAKSGNGYVIVKIRKYSGTTETEIANNQSDILSDSGTGVWTDPEIATELLEIDCPETLFKAGDSLRVTIEMWAKISQVSAVDARYTIGHEPSNSDLSGQTSEQSFASSTQTKFQIDIPFKLFL